MTSGTDGAWLGAVLILIAFLAGVVVGIVAASIV